MNRRITVKYCFLQGGYWTLAAVAMAFTTPLLEAKGFSGTEIGIYGGVIMYMAIGLCLGVAFGTALDNLPLGIAIGVAVGAGIDSSRSSKRKKDKEDEEDEDL